GAPVAGLLEVDDVPVEALVEVVAGVLVVALDAGALVVAGVLDALELLLELEPHAVSASAARIATAAPDAPRERVENIGISLLLHVVRARAPLPFARLGDRSLCTCYVDSKIIVALTTANTWEMERELMADTKKAFWEVKNTRFVAGDPRDEFLHPQAREHETGPELTETQYLGFNIPEHDIHALCYLWHHPNLGVVSGGAWVWQGIKEGTMSCELFDWLNYVDDAVLASDFH